MRSFNPDELHLRDLHGYLLGAIAPRPIAWASTVDKQGNVNLAPFSFFNVFSTKPPILIFSPAISGKTGKTKNTLDNVLEVPECVVNIVNHDNLMQMSYSSAAFDPDVDEFEKTGLTKAESAVVRPPRVAESPVQFECKVLEVKSMGDNGGAGQLIICRVVHFHVSESVIDSTSGRIDPLKMDQVARNGGAWYTHANAESMFEVNQPAHTGVGYESLPQSVRNSRVLTGNQLGQLISHDAVPTEDDVKSIRDVAEVQQLIENHGHDYDALLEAIHHAAAGALQDEKTWYAWKLLMLGELARP